MLILSFKLIVTHKSCDETVMWSSKNMWNTITMWQNGAIHTYVKQITHINKLSIKSVKYFTRYRYRIPFRGYQIFSFVSWLQKILAIQTD